jgi:hypothetical protein
MLRMRLSSDGGCVPTSTQGGPDNRFAVESPAPFQPHINLITARGLHPRVQRSFDHYPHKVRVALIDDLSERRGNQDLHQLFRGTPRQP